MINQSTIHKRRPKRVARIRVLLKGTLKRPRLEVYRSHKGLYGQLINDENHMTIVSAKSKGTNMASGLTLGTKIAVYCRKKGIKRLIFDRGGYKYHGVIKHIADTVREGGIII